MFTFCTFYFLSSFSLFILPTHISLHTKQCSDLLCSLLSPSGKSDLVSLLPQCCSDLGAGFTALIFVLTSWCHGTELNYSFNSLAFLTSSGLLNSLTLSNLLFPKFSDKYSSVQVSIPSLSLIQILQWWIFPQQGDITAQNRSASFYSPFPLYL